MQQMNERLPLDLVAALDALIRAQSVTRSAAALGISQPAMSHKLQRLRALLRDPILVGSRRHPVLTDRARLLAAPVQRLLADADALLHIGTAFDPSTATRRFRIATDDIGELAVLPAAFERLHRSAPGISIEARAIDEHLAVELARGEIDLCVGRPQPASAGLMQRVIADQPFVLVLRKGHPAISRGAVSRDAFERLRHVVARGDLVSQSELVLRGPEKPTKIAMELQTNISAPFLVARSDLALTTTRFAAVEAARLVPIVVLPHPLRLPHFKLALTWHARAQNDAGHRWLRQVAEETTREVIAGHGLRSKRARARTTAPRPAR